MPLLSRRVLPPGGFVFFQPQTNWRVPMPMLDFESVVKEIIKHRAANPRWNWSLDFDDVANELDNFTCVRLANNPQYCTGGSASFLQAPSLRQSQTAGPLQSVRNAVGASRRLAAGVGVLIDWLGSGAKPVDDELATRRAEICAGCPLNEKKDLTSFFTIPAANLIKKQIEIKNELKCVTKFDDYLGICSACACVMKTKVWTPIKHVTKHLLPESREKLDRRCWVLSEEIKL